MRTDIDAGGQLLADMDLANAAINEQVIEAADIFARAVSAA